MDIGKILNQVKNGELDIEQAESILKKLPYEDIGFAKIDHHRSVRSGIGEVVYCEGKTEEQVSAIFKGMFEQEKNVLGTRATAAHFEAVRKIIPSAQFDAVSRILTIHAAEVKKVGCIAICTGGTSDIPVAEEAAQTAEFLGSGVLRIYDVGVAGIHRLFSKLDQIRSANCIVAVAGMEGALGGVMAGLVDKPVIAVPTSIGYGTNFKGISALLTMLNSCAEGLAVVNIDNGFGAGYMSSQINQLAVKGQIKA